MRKTEERQSNPQQGGEQGPALARLTFILSCIPVLNFILIPSGHLQHSFQPSLWSANFNCLWLHFHSHVDCISLQMGSSQLWQKANSISKRCNNAHECGNLISRTVTLESSGLISEHVSKQVTSAWAFALWTHMFNAILKYCQCSLTGQKGMQAR